MGILSAKVFDCENLIEVPYSRLEWCSVFIPENTDLTSPTIASKIEGFVKTTDTSAWDLTHFWLNEIDAFFDQDGWLVERCEGIVCRMSLRICTLWTHFDTKNEVAMAGANQASSIDYELHRGAILSRLFAVGAMLPLKREIAKKPKPIANPPTVKIKSKARVKGRKGFVYVVKAGQNHFKVGFSIDPSDRLSNYRSLMPEACVVKLFPDLTMRKEKILHKKLRAMFAGQGEVYYVSEEDLLNAMSQILIRINYQE